jgi:hypothetical protein
MASRERLMEPRIGMTVTATPRSRTGQYRITGDTRADMRVVIPMLPGQCPFYTMTSDDMMLMRNLQ